MIPRLFPRALLFSCCLRAALKFSQCQHVLVEPSSGVVCFNVYTVTRRSRSLPLSSAWSSLIKRSVNEIVNCLGQVWLWVRMREVIAQIRREICCLQHGETESNVWNTFVWSCPTWPSRWGMRISIDWPRLKSCQAVCDECTWGEIIYSSLSRDAGCLAMWSWRESCVAKIWGSGHDHGFVLFLLRYHGFPYSTIGDFLDPNIRVIRGPYCTFLLELLWAILNGIWFRRSSKWLRIQ